jgi:hypothetical protein
MSHPIYSRQQLGGKKLSKVKQIAAELGVVPSGNKTFLVSWIDAIVEHQAAQVQKIQAVEATIDFESESFEGSTQPYMVLVGGEIVHRAATYQQAERHCKWQGYILVDSQALAQNELEAELEVQAATRADKAKSVEVLEQVASRISFISPSDFGFYEAILDGNVNNVIATIDHESLGTWRVEMNGIKKPFISYQKAEEFVKGVFMDERGSGRITQPIGDMGMTIEDSNFIHDFGQSYTLRVHGALAGDIFLDDDHGWTMNGEDFSQDWQPVAKELIRLTRREYEHLLAA